MPFPEHVFRHMPALIGKIIAPDVSDVRFGQDHFVELEEQAVAESWPSDWRMDHDAREANRRAVMAGRMDQDLWVFGYGSLIWDPAVMVDEYRYASLPGWRRRFCMRIEGGRGSFEQPGLMAALDEGGHCDGVVLRIPAAVVDQETEFMWRREMFAGTYCPTFREVTTPQGPVEALIFLMDFENRRYAPDISEEDAARMIAVAEGRLGPNFDYLDKLVRHLEELGIEDDDMRRLHARAVTLRASR